MTFMLFDRRFHIDPQLRDHVLLTLWIIITFKQFKNDELLLYPLALYFFWAFIRDFHLIFDILCRSIILWAFPVWWFLSLSWGAETALILKTGLQLVLTLMICYCVVARLEPRQILLSAFIASGWFGISSFVNDPQGLSATGVFKSKNAFGGAMVILLASSLCVALDRGFGRFIRLAAVLAVPLAVLMISRSHSATAVLLGLGGVVIIFGLQWMRFFTGAAFLATLCLLTGLVTLVAAFGAMTIPVFDPVAQVLGHFGKDTTLTGRTILWEYAERQIAEQPLLGVGHGGFWTPQDGLSEARRIYDDFHKATHATFSFHNSYFEIAVHQGLIGMSIVIATTIWIVQRILHYAFSSQEAATSFILCIAMISVAQSFTEVILMVPFHLLFMLFVIGALLSTKSRSRTSQERFDGAVQPI